MSPENIIEKSKVSEKYIEVEEQVLNIANNGFLPKLYFTFQDRTSYWICMEYCPGKDLAYYLDNEGWFSEKKSRFYLSEWIVAIQKLHDKKIVYRDLKPNNVMLDSLGHIKLIDFNLSKVSHKNEKVSTKSFWGSYAYMPPEVIKRSKYGVEVDWYLCGVLLYEMLTGLPPYFSRSASKWQLNILKEKLEIPDDVSDECADLLEKLLDKDPSKRIGTNSGASEIFSHSWFEEITFEQVEDK